MNDYVEVCFSPFVALADPLAARMRRVAQGRREVNNLVARNPFV
ncbi:MAG: hypothetical protein ACRERU_10915 [Methylococcales bacterium]